MFWKKKTEDDWTAWSKPVKTSSAFFRQVSFHKKTGIMRTEIIACTLEQEEMDEAIKALGFKFWETP